MAKLFIYRNEGDRTFVGVDNAPAIVLCKRLIEELETGPEVFVRLQSDEDPLLDHLIWWEDRESFENHILSTKRQYGLSDGMVVQFGFTRLKEFINMIFEFERGNEDD